MRESWVEVKKRANEGCINGALRFWSSNVVGRCSALAASMPLAVTRMLQASTQTAASGGYSLANGPADDGAPVTTLHHEHTCASTAAAHMWVTSTHQKET